MIMYYEQNFPIVEKKACDKMERFVTVKDYSTGHKERDINHIEIEVFKDYHGAVKYLVKGANIYDSKSILDYTNILMTDNFNEAFDLNLKIEDLFKADPYRNKEYRAHVKGSLQADPDRWNAEKEHTPFNNLLIQSSKAKSSEKHSKRLEPER